jgi:glutathione S-transferase
MHIRFIYFNFPFWRAEASRIALFMAGIEFEDVRPGREEFRAMKSSGELPYGQLPVMDVDGTRIAQSVAIARLCGQLAGLYPENDPIAQARIDELLDTATDVTFLISPTMRERDPETKRAMRQKLGKEDLPRWLAFIERRLNSEGPYAVSDTLSIADLVLWRLTDWLTSGLLDGLPTNLLDAHPKLRDHHDHIGALPKVTQWMRRYES